eukprot:scaffold32263_cov129-Isochrysis_galbana.AAC.1
MQEAGARAGKAVRRVPGGGLLRLAVSVAGSALSAVRASATAVRHSVVGLVARLATAAEQALALLREWANVLLRRAASVPKWFAGDFSAFRGSAAGPPDRPTSADSRWWLPLPLPPQLPAVLSAPRRVLAEAYAALLDLCGALYTTAAAAAAQPAALPATAAHAAAELARIAGGLARAPLPAARRLLESVCAEARARYAATSAAVSAAPAAVSSVVVGVPVAAVAWGKRVTGHSNECLTSAAQNEVKGAGSTPSRQTDAPVWVWERRALNRGERAAGGNGIDPPPPSPVRFPRAQQVLSASSASRIAGRAARRIILAGRGIVPSWIPAVGAHRVAAGGG